MARIAIAWCCLCLLSVSLSAHAIPRALREMITVNTPMSTAPNELTPSQQKMARELLRAELSTANPSRMLREQFAVPSDLMSDALKIFFVNINGVWEDRNGYKTYIYFTPEVQLVFFDHKNAWSNNYRLEEPFAGNYLQTIHQLKSLRAFDGRLISEHESRLLWCAIEGLSKLEHVLERVGNKQEYSDPNVRMMQMKAYFNNWPLLVSIDQYNISHERLVFHYAGAQATTKNYEMLEINIDPHNPDKFSISAGSDNVFSYVRDLKESEEQALKSIALNLMPRHAALAKQVGYGIRGYGRSVVDSKIYDNFFVLSEEDKEREYSAAMAASVSHQERLMQEREAELKAHAERIARARAQSMDEEDVIRKAQAAWRLAKENLNESPALDIENALEEAYIPIQNASKSAETNESNAP